MSVVSDRRGLAPIRLFQGRPLYAAPVKRMLSVNACATLMIIPYRRRGPGDQHKPINIWRLSEPGGDAELGAAN